MRIILDTNLWISYLLTNRLLGLDQLIKSQTILLLFSEESLEEFIEVAQRPKFSKYFSSEDLSELLELFDLYGEIIIIKSDLRLCRDTNDDFLLNLAKDGNADFLITGDKDLLVLDKMESTQIITYDQFLKELKFTG